MHIPLGLPAPAWLVRLAAPLLDTGPDLAIYGRYLISKRLREHAFIFQYPTLPQALAELLARPEKRTRFNSRPTRP